MPLRPKWGICTGGGREEGEAADKEGTSGGRFNTNIHVLRLACGGTYGGRAYLARWRGLWMGHHVAVRMLLGKGRGGAVPRSGGWAG